MANEFNIAQEVNNTFLSPEVAKNISEDIIANVVVPAINLGIAGFKIPILQNETIALSSNITDLYLENNSSIVQHISNKPMQITLVGYVGETIFRIGNTNTGIVQSGTEKLTVAGSLLPSLSNAEQAVRDTIQAATAGGGTYEVLTNTLTATENLYALYQNALNATTEQGRVFQFFKALWSSKALISVDTRFGFYQNMAIENLRFSGLEKTADASQIEVTLKQINFASSQLVPFDVAQYESKSGIQNQGVKTSGTNNTQSVSTQEVSFLKSLF